MQGEGITLDSSLLQDYIQVLIMSLTKNAELSECLENVSGGNVREALNLLTSFVGSGHVDTKKILDIYSRSHRYVIPVHEFLRAIIYGDNEYYDPASSPVPNVLDLGSRNAREHFLLPIILNHLERQGQRRASDMGFVDVGRIFDHAQSIGFTNDDINSALVRGTDIKVLEFSITSVDRCRLTQLGAYVLNRLLRSFVYYDAVVVDTPILSDEVRPLMLDARSISQRLERGDIFLKYLNAKI